MRLVILEAESLGKDMDLSGFSRFGEVTVYEKTTEEECPERVREADIVICNKVRMCSRTLSGAGRDGHGRAGGADEKDVFPR